MSTERLEITVDGPGRLDAVLAARAPGLSRARIASLIREGRAAVDGVVVRRPSTRVAAGAVLTLEVPEPAPDRAVPQDLPLRIAYQDADVVVVDKAPGMVVHPGAGHPDGTLVNALLHHVGDLSGIGGVLRPGIVHRLDRGTSGLLVVAKHDAAHRALAAQFADRTAGRTYLALVRGEPRADRGTLDAPIGRHRVHRVRFTSVDPAGEPKRAVTHWEVLGRAAGHALVKCRLQTGRTHQIRVHLADAGHPLVGDPLYGPRRARGEGDRPMLHAWKLRFAHPSTGEMVGFEAPLPADFAAALRALGIPDPTR